MDERVYLVRVTIASGLWETQKVNAFDPEDAVGKAFLYLRTKPEDVVQLECRLLDEEVQ